jgi:hypothetical protein
VQRAVKDCVASRIGEIKRSERLQVEGSASSQLGSGKEKAFAREIGMLKCRKTKRGLEHQEKTSAGYTREMAHSDTFRGSASRYDSQAVVEIDLAERLGPSQTFQERKEETCQDRL